TVDVVKAIAYSSDIFFYQVAGGGPGIPGYGLGPRRLGYWARRFNLGRPTGLDLPGEEPGLVPGPRELRRLHSGRAWSWGDSYNSGIGQGDTLVTPIQMANVAA